MKLPTDTQMLEWLLTSITGALAGEVTPELEANAEALQQGYKLGLRGRELVCAAMNTVRFDVDTEKAEEVAKQLEMERTDSELLGWINQRVLAGVEFTALATTVMASEVVSLRMRQKGEPPVEFIGSSFRDAAKRMQEWIDGTDALDSVQ